MGDMGDYWREAKEDKERAKKFMRPCPCGARSLWPGQKCKDCGHKDERKKSARRA